MESKRSKAATYGKAARRTATGLSAATMQAFNDASQSSATLQKGLQVRVSTTKPPSQRNENIETRELNISASKDRVGKDTEISSRAGAEKEFVGARAVEIHDELDRNASGTESRKKRKLDTQDLKVDSVAKLAHPADISQSTKTEVGTEPGRNKILKRTGRLAGFPGERRPLPLPLASTASERTRVPANQPLPSTLKAVKVKEEKAPFKQYPSQRQSAEKRASESEPQPHKRQMQRTVKSPLSQSPRTPTSSPPPLPRKAANKPRQSVSMRSPVKPQTPPKAINPRASSITPKQADMFSRLLSETPSSSRTSPGRVDLGRDVTASPPKSGLQSPLRDSPIRRTPRLIDALDPSGILESDSGSDSEESEKNRRLHPAVSPNARKHLARDDMESGHQAREVDLASSQGQILSGSSISLSQGNGPKVTYARQRSYLSEPVALNSGLSQLSESQAPFKTRDDPLALLPEDSGGASFDFPDDDLQEPADSQTGTMKSLRELREAGGNRRLLQEFDANLEDLGERHASSLSTRRSALMTLARKMLEPTNSRLFVDHSLERRLFKYVDITTDLMERVLLLFVLLELLVNVSSIPFISSKDRLMVNRIGPFLSSFLASTNSLSDDNMRQSVKASKHVHAEFDELCKSMLRLRIWGASRPDCLSLQLLALQGLERIVRQARESGTTGVLYPTETVESIVMTSVRLRGSSDEATESSNKNAALSARLAISTLESCTATTALEQEDLKWPMSVHERLRDYLSHLLEQRAPSADTEGLKLLLRLHLNLTNTNEHLCKVYASVDSVHSLLRYVISEFQQLLDLKQGSSTTGDSDSLLLSLGCLINFADLSDGVRKAIIKLGGGGREILQTLVGLFQQERKRVAEVSSEEQAGFVVSYGYLSILLTYLCVDESLRVQAQTRLEKDSSNFEDLLKSAEQFLQYHRQIDDSFRQSNVRHEHQDYFVSRSQIVIDSLRKAT